ncbi:hypothetical protein C441_04519 [Haloferax sulfurifontis ATCC BAA-897]|nr:hypothetical protein C441_04519 [Haloferax sulfurifontis ATCC BAA-897]
MKSPERDLFNSMRGDVSQSMFLLGLLSVLDDEQIEQARLVSKSYSYEALLLNAAESRGLVDEIAKYERVRPLISADGGRTVETED